ncbi:MAG TPA: sigma-70 family RNA polymerase sigma factor [Candidatus Angelobacter sp.]|nr:sigma-70 family RNA polymerase sigma factor [Candidatus Angelobacter sp.]
METPADLEPAPADALEQTPEKPEIVVANDIENLMQQAGALESTGAGARRAGDETAAQNCFRAALGFAADAVGRTDGSSSPARLEILRVAVRIGLQCGETARARQWMEEARQTAASTVFADDWQQLRDETAWPDEWLIASVRGEPPDSAALDALVQRYWKTLYGRCHMLTLNQSNASDLAQDAWRRVLKARHRLNPGGHFAAYLVTIATNLWRDAMRSAGRAGPMAEHRLASLNDTVSNSDDDSITLMEVLPDSNAAHEQERKLLALDIDEALAKLSPHLRDVLTSRFLNGESCAEIGERYERTEQTVSGWVRAAIQQMKTHLEDRKHADPQEHAL